MSPSLSGVLLIFIRVFAPLHYNVSQLVRAACFMISCVALFVSLSAGATLAVFSFFSPHAHSINDVAKTAVSMYVFIVYVILCANLRIYAASSSLSRLESL